MSTNQNLQIIDKYLSKQRSMPFDHYKVIAPNPNYFGILLNQLAMICRLLVIIYCTLKLSSKLLLICFSKSPIKLLNLDFSEVSSYETLLFWINVLVNLALIVDCINPSYFLKTLNDFKSSMTMSRIISQWGINIHLFRFILINISVYREKLDLGMLSHYYDAGSADTLFLIALDFLFIPAIAAYILALILKYIGYYSGNQDEVSHPWLNDWEGSYMYRNVRHRIFKWPVVFFLIVNLVFMLYFANFFLSFHYADRQFHMDWKDTVSVFLPATALFILIFNLLFKLYKGLYEFSVCRVFTWNYMFLGYFCLAMYVEIKDTSFNPKLQGVFQTQLNVTCIVLAVLSAVNLIVILIVGHHELFSVLLYFIKWFSSCGVISSLLSTLGAVLMFLGFAYATYSLLQQYFYLNIKLDEIFKKFLEHMKEIYDKIMSVIGVVEDALIELNKVSQGGLCYSIFSALIIVIPALSFIGFGAAVPGMIAAFAINIVIAVFKFFKTIKNYMKLFENIGKFTSRSELMQATAANTSAQKLKQGGVILMITNAFSGIMVFLGLATIYFYSAERLLAITRPIYLGLMFLVGLICFMYICFLYIMELMMSQKYDLIIMIIEIIPGWGIQWIRISAILYTSGLFCVLISYIIGYSAGWIKNQFYDDEYNIEHYACPSLNSVICPLLSDLKENDREKNSCRVVCGRLLFCFSSEADKINDGDTPAHYFKKIYCPCFTDLDPVSDNYRLVNLCSNICCFCCLTATKTRRCNLLKCGFCLTNFFEVKKLKTELDDKTSASIISDSLIPNDQWTYRTYFNLQSAKSKPTSLGQFKKIHAPLSLSSEDYKTAFMKQSERYLKNGFKHIVKYILPLLLIFPMIYYAYLAITNRWLLVSFEPKGELAKTLNDTSTQANQDHMADMESNKKSMCPALDLINVIKNLVIDTVFSLLKDVYPDYAEFFETMKNVLMFITDVGGDELVPPFLRIILISPVIINMGIIVILSVVSAFFKPLSRLKIIFLTIPIYLLYLALMSLPMWLKFIIENIPLFDIYCNVEMGYGYAKALGSLTMLVYVAMIVDHFMEITFPMPDENEETVKMYDDELDSVLAT